MAGIKSNFSLVEKYPGDFFYPDDDNTIIFKLNGELLGIYGEELFLMI
ncbi:MAG: hypothetical protein AAGB12_11325 [Pseudomonadota bacterium]